MQSCAANAIVFAVAWIVLAVGRASGADPLYVSGATSFAWGPTKLASLLPVGQVGGLFGDDYRSAAIPLNFTFLFYGAPYDSVSLCSNGWLSFNAADLTMVGWAPALLPSTGGAANGRIPDAWIGGFWADLTLGENGGSITYETIGTAPNRQFIARWTAVPYRYSSNSTTTFQICLFEATYAIEFHYLKFMYGAQFGIPRTFVAGIQSDKYRFASMIPTMMVVSTWTLARPIAWRFEPQATSLGLNRIGWIDNSRIDVSSTQYCAVGVPCWAKEIRYDAVGGNGAWCAASGAPGTTVTIDFAANHYITGFIIQPGSAPSTNRFVTSVTVQTWNGFRWVAQHNSTGRAGRDNSTNVLFNGALSASVDSNFNYFSVDSSSSGESSPVVASQARVTIQGFSGSPPCMRLDFFGAAASTSRLGQSLIGQDIYRLLSIPFFVASIPGSTAVGSLTDDSISIALDIGFTFVFYGRAYTQLYVSSNGWMSFESPSQTYAPATLPTTAYPGAATFWTDLTPDASSSHQYKTVGVAPNRQWVFQVFNISHYTSSGPLGPRVSVQVVLYETTNAIELHYLSIKPFTGRFVTAGINSRQLTANGKAYGQFIPRMNKDTAPTLNGVAWRFTPNFGDLGIGNFQLSDANIIPSSSRYANATQNIRLGFTEQFGGWSASVAAAGATIKVNLGGMYYLTHVATQGRAGTAEYTTSYNVGTATSIDGPYTSVYNQANSATFTGNSDGSTIVTNAVGYGLIVGPTQFVQLTIASYTNWPSLRFALYGIPTYCSDAPCQHGGTCTEGPPYSCVCPSGYSGTDCENNNDDCPTSGVVCSGRGECVDGVQSYTCVCNPGYTGAACQTNINECAPVPCANGGTCIDLIAAYTCLCAAGFAGDQCLTNVNECASAPCVNGGTCVDAVNRFSCVCVAGYSGLLCQTDINECASAPCVAGASSGCTDVLNGFQCTCLAGYSGTRCQTNINECASSPCENGATCLDLLNGFNCSCATGFVGTTCNIDVNECATANGGCFPIQYSDCTNTFGSYHCSIYFVPNSFKIVSGLLNSTTPIVLASTAPGSVLQFNISHTTWDWTTLAFTIGTVASPLAYSCAQVVRVPPLKPSNQCVRCTLPLASGVSLRASVVNGTGSIFSTSNGTFSYPPPTLIAGTLRSNTSALTATSVLLPPNANSVIVEFDGRNLVPSASLVSVYYGVLGAPFQYPCLFSPVLSTFTTISCTTQVYSQGSLMRFTVQLAGDQVSVLSSDAISFPGLPGITSVTGCSLLAGNGTASCPTAGGVTITIFGFQFKPPINVLIGSQQCTQAVASADESRITCRLPPGSGSDVAVTVSTATQLSPPQPYLSYAPPTITGLSSDNCMQDSVVSVIECPREGGSVITISGANFGAIPPAVLVGSTLCQDVQADGDVHSRLTCKIAAGNAINRPVLLLQAGGAISISNATLSYVRCAVGTIENGAGGCTPCPDGLIAAIPGSTLCSACPPGQASGPAPASTCTQCPIGAVAIGGTRDCTNCSAGFFIPAKSQSLCNPCLPGEFSATNGSSGCSPCLAGSSQPSFGQSTCNLCAPGRWQNAPNQADCNPCPVGQFSPLPGAKGCIPCGLGAVASVAGSSTCGNCTAGSFSNLPGQGTCILCAPGSFTSRNGTIKCDPCPPGSFTSTSGEPECRPCEAGTYNDNPNAPTCKSCPAGYYTNGTGFAQPTPCELGYFQPENGQSSCAACPPGSGSVAVGQPSCRECGVGKFALTAGSNACNDCPLGTSQPGTNGTGCIPCEPGKYAGNRGTISCLPCPAGTYYDMFGAPACNACPAGRYQSSDGKQNCSLCLPGQFSIARQSSCSICSAGEANPYPGRHACITCPANSFPLQDRTRCDCLPGYYYLPSGAPPPVVSDLSTNETASDLPADTCEACEDGMICEVAGQTVESLVAANGWWRSSNSSLQFLQCLQSSKYGACASAPQSASHLTSRACRSCVDGHCASNRYGPLCAVCERGYQQPTQGSACEKCPTQSTALGGTIGFSALLLAILIVVFYLVWKAEGSNVVTVKGATFTRVRLWAPEDRARPSFTYNLKIMLSFLQIATSLMTFVEIPWPTYFQTFINYFTFLNLDFIPWSSVQCVATLTFYDRLVLVAVVPVVVIFFVAVVPRLILAVCNQFDMSDTDHARHDRMLSRRKIIKLLVFALFLMYPSLSSRVLSFFICRRVNGTDYLVADFQLQCFDSEWFRYLPLGVACVLVYPLGIPFFLFYVVYANRFNLRDSRTLSALGILYEAYDFRYYFFELCDMAEKLFLTSLLGFFASAYQPPVGMFAIIVYMMIHLIISPYVRTIDDRFCLIAQAHLFLILTLAYTLQQSAFVRGSLIDILASILMLAVLAALVVVLIIHGVIFARKVIRTRQRLEMISRYAPGSLAEAFFGGSTADKRSAAIKDEKERAELEEISLTRDSADRRPNATGFYRQNSASPSLGSSQHASAHAHDPPPLSPQASSSDLLSIGPVTPPPVTRPPANSHVVPLSRFPLSIQNKIKAEREAETSANTASVNASPASAASPAPASPAPSSHAVPLSRFPISIQNKVKAEREAEASTSRTAAPVAAGATSSGDVELTEFEPLPPLPPDA